MRNPFWPFTDVLREIFASLTRKVGFFAETNEGNEDSLLAKLDNSFVNFC